MRNLPKVFLRSFKNIQPSSSGKHNIVNNKSVDGRQHGSLADDNRHRESNMKSIGRPVPEISSFEISEMLTYVTS